MQSLACVTVVLCALVPPPLSYPNPISRGPTRQQQRIRRVRVGVGGAVVRGSCRVWVGQDQAVAQHLQFAAPCWSKFKFKLQIKPVEQHPQLTGWRQPPHQARKLSAQPHSTLTAARRRTRSHMLPRCSAGAGQATTCPHFTGLASMLRACAPAAST